MNASLAYEPGARLDPTFFTCKGSHFSFAVGPKKYQKKFHTFHLQGMITLFTCRDPKEVSHFSLAGVTLFTCRGHTFHLQTVQKNAKRKFTLFTYWGLKNTKRKFAFFPCRGSKKCQKKVRTFHLQRVQKKSQKKVCTFHSQRVTLFTCRRFEKRPKECSDFSFAGSPKKC